MKIFTTVITTVITLALSNCTPARMVSDNFTNDTKTSKVGIHRESKIIFVGVAAIVGYDEKDKLLLSNGSKSEIEVPIGKHEFFVRSNLADRPAKLSVEIKEGKSTCVVVNPRVEALIIPLYWWFFHAFKIEERDGAC